MGLAVGGGLAACLSSREPLDGPGPSGPATFGTPVSATVGVTVGTFVAGSDGLGATIGEVFALGIGMGAGAWFKLAGFNGGDVVPGEGAVASTGEEGVAAAGTGIGLAKGELDGCETTGDGGNAELCEGAGGGAAAVVGGGVMGTFVDDGLSVPIRESSFACVSPKERVCLRSAEVGFATMRPMLPGE